MSVELLKLAQELRAEGYKKGAVLVRDIAQSLERNELIPHTFNPETIIINGNFSQQIKGYRERLGLTQRKLAQETGLNHSTISRLEGAEREPTASTAFVLIRGLRLNSEQIAGFLESVHQDR